MKSKLLYLSMFVLTLSACHNNSNSDTSAATSTDSTSHSSTDSSAANNSGGMQKMADDSSFLVTANDIGMFEIKIGNLAQTNSQDAQVKEMANMMVTDHTAMGKDVSTLAQKKNVSLPDSLSSDMQKEYNKLKGLTGKKFDKEYASVNVKGHGGAITLFEKTSSDKDCSPEVQQLASSALPTLKKHKEHSDMLEKHVGM